MKNNYYIYFYYLNKQIVYIGQTIHLEKRVYQHSKEQKFIEYYKNNQVEMQNAIIKYFKCSSKTEMDGLEKILINQFKPPLNIKDVNYGKECVFEIDITKFEWIDYNNNVQNSNIYMPKRYTQTKNKCKEKAIVYEPIPNTQNEQKTVQTIYSRNKHGHEEEPEPKWNKTITLKEAYNSGLSKYDMLYEYGVWKDKDGYKFIWDMSNELIDANIKMFQMLNPSNAPFVKLFQFEKERRNSNSTNDK